MEIKQKEIEEQTKYLQRKLEVADDTASAIGDNADADAAGDDNDVDDSDDAVADDVASTTGDDVDAAGEDNDGDDTDDAVADDAPSDIAVARFDNNKDFNVGDEDASASNTVADDDCDDGDGNGDGEIIDSGGCVDDWRGAER
ncbi:hypothetical protein AWC38_SpisGene18139 [Stylophora pistillata]|uniref:Uncharacterized protein n=1 Tax=Stylophora pistillata TaxID=50429 RepID=A0A2B4RL46_STYPI|nr:hypothetical protein AWC38_SpisGene18139 [Stylophora pistillata]